MNSVASVLYPILESRGDRVGFRMQLESGGYREVTCVQYVEQSRRLATFLRGKGVQQGDRVLLVSENSPEWTMIFLACNSIGATLVPVSAMSTAAEIHAIVERAQPKFAFLSLNVANNDKLSLKVAYATVNAQTDDPLEKLIKNESLIASDVFLTEANAGDRDAFLIFTSGTTGSPKAVPLTNTNVLTNLQGCKHLIKANESDSLVSVLPLSHMFEMMAGFLTAVYLGASITYTKSLRPEDIIRAMKETKATVMVAVPLLFEVMSRTMQEKVAKLPKPMKKYYEFMRPFVKKQQGFGRYAFYLIHRAFGGRIKYFVAGGSRLSPEVYNFFEGIGIKILQGYGLTETSPVLSCSTIYNAGPDHVGHPLKGVELAVFSDDGKRLGVGEEGEIRARGDSVFRGYLDDEHNEGVFADGWFCTGDLGVIDTEGNVTVTGRKKDIIVTPGGKNVYPEEVEECLKRSGRFIESTVLGMFDEKGGEKVAAVVVPEPGNYAQLSARDLRKAVERDVRIACRDLSDYKQPQQVHIWQGELPKTLTRKVKKFEVRKKLAEKPAEKTEAMKPSENALDLSDPLEKLVAEKISAITGKPAAFINRTDSLIANLGVDSITFIEIVSTVEKHFDRIFDIPELASVETVDELLLVLRPQINASKRTGPGRDVWFADFSPVSFTQAVFRIPFIVLNTLVRLFLFATYRVRIHNAKALKTNGPLIITPNHVSHFDTVTLLSVIPWSRIAITHAVAAKDYFFKTSLLSLLSRISLNAIPFDRKRRVDQSMQRCSEALRSGHSLIIFPEGTRSATGKLQPFKPGVGHLAKQALDVKVLPVFIDGTYKILPKGRTWPRFGGSIDVFFGDPVSFSDVDDSREGYKKIADSLEQQVRKLAKSVSVK